MTVMFFSELTALSLFQSSPSSSSAPSYLTTTSIIIPGTLRAKITCADIVDNATFYDYKYVFESSIADMVTQDLAEKQDLSYVTVTKMCDTAASFLFDQRNLQSVLVTNVSYSFQVNESCEFCNANTETASQLFVAVTGNLTEDINNGNLTNSLHQKAAESNVTGMTQVSVEQDTSEADFGQFILLTSSPSAVR